MSRFSRSTFALLALLLVAQPALADSPAEYEADESIAPVANSELADVGLRPVSPEIRPPDYDILFDGLTCFGFLPAIEYIKNTDDVVLVSWCEQGGWANDGSASITRYSLEGEPVAGPRGVQDLGDDPFPHNAGWEVVTFPADDGGGAGPALPLIIATVPGSLPDFPLPFPMMVFRTFDGDLNPLSEVLPVHDPALVSGNDDRDVYDNQNPEGIALSDSTWVIASAFPSAEMQKSVGIEDPGPEMAPGAKCWFRVMNRDGTPRSDSKLCFPTDSWTEGQSGVDVAARPDGAGFVFVGTHSQSLPNGDIHPIFMYDAEGNFEGMRGVTDPQLITTPPTYQSTFPQPEISQQAGIYALGHNIRIADGASIGGTFSATLFEEFVDGGGETQLRVLRSTFNISRHKAADGNGLRESDIGQDELGNVMATCRGKGPTHEGGADTQDDVTWGALATREGERFALPFAVPDPEGYPGSQRDPVVTAGLNRFAFAYLSNAPDPEGVNAHGGLNTLRIFTNPLLNGPFDRGDCNGDGSADITDAVVILNNRFQGGPPPGCLAACDFNGDGNLDITNVVYFLNFQFQGGPAMPPPAGECGFGTTAQDRLSTGCETPQELCN